MRTKLVLIALVAFSLFSKAQVGRGLIVVPDTQLILIGDRVNLQVILKCDGTDKVQFPTIGDTLTKDLEVVTQSWPDTTVDPNNMRQRIISQNISVTAWDSGVYYIPSLVATINGDSAFSQSFPIQVFTIPIDSTNAITDIKANIEVPLTFWDYLEIYGPYIFGGWAVLAALFLIWYLFIRKKKKKVEYVEPEVRIPAHVLALERLLQLEEKQLWQKGKFKEFHVRLSEILREYLENRYKILALEQTTDEILGDLRPLGVNEEIRNQLREVLLLMDLVKFAKQQPLANENEGALKAIRNVIEQTKKIEETPQPK